ncbi:ABC transporter ATP-binding protein [Bradyrhizobium sp. AUGA SZCCT0222]|uniref:ABC transporter ATP-binding protein n=1 Tax=Bradyrhizobium sp. AUGA SZCCT0222 TaxID=2807668 RepID=UPI001BA7DEB6|nr:ABC transporter ATP-binding protein [Bradyrhizobium sp. AUGA SZCCT0222]MBR1269400.1 ABC transporter ATP-binding protein [Bradyrhizobium sp. AUGA SZCCT0222]
MSARIDIIAVTKTYDGTTRAVDAVDMSIGEGEFFSLLGPSGCGKTTTLRMIAGFETPTEGVIEVGGLDVTHVPAHKRDMGMVFQNYALFPHRTVGENVAFGLRMRGMDRSTIARKVTDALAQVELVGYEDRRPGELSGGQQQRVALARAIVIEPRVLLCDEPLGALDKKLRQAMQFELKQLQRKLGLTMVFVTHDQEEALAMSDRIAVMNAGRVEQIGAPSDIYDRPSTRFVADFIGDTNLFRGEVIRDGGGNSVLQVDKGLSIALAAPPKANGVVSIALRPEKISLATPPALTDHGLDGVVESANFQGGSVLYRIETAGGRRLLAQQPNNGSHQLFPAGAAVALRWKPSDIVILRD